MNRLDGKVYGRLFKNKDGSEIPEDEFLVFRPQDTAFFNILPTYLAELQRLGADKAQLDAVAHMIDKVRDWREKHTDRCKVADCAPKELPEGW